MQGTNLIDHSLASCYNVAGKFKSTCTDVKNPVLIQTLEQTQAMVDAGDIIDYNCWKGGFDQSKCFDYEDPTFFGIETLRIYESEDADAYEECKELEDFQGCDSDD